MTTLAERLREARTDLGLSQEDVAQLAGVSNGTIGNIENGTRLNPRSLLEIAAAVQVEPTWLKSGRPPKRAANWTPEQHPSEGVVIRPEAQDLSHPTADDEPTTVAWEFIVSAESPLPARFRVAMPDDALAPTTPRGTVLIFSTTAVPAFGHGVLVRDAAGQRHVRRYAQGPGGRWLAEARNSAYLTLDSADPGVQLLAVVVGRETGEV